MLIYINIQNYPIINAKISQNTLTKQNVLVPGLSIENDSSIPEEGRRIVKKIISIVSAILFMCFISVYSQKNNTTKTVCLSPSVTINEEEADRTACDASGVYSKQPNVIQRYRNLHNGYGYMGNPMDYDEDDIKYGWLNDDINFVWGCNYFLFYFENKKMSEQYEDQINPGKVEMINPLLRI